MAESRLADKYSFYFWVGKMKEKNELMLIYDEDKKEKELMAYMPSPFIVAALPTRAVKKVPFVRKFNDITLTLSGVNQVPYGKNGRLLLTIFTTHAVLSKNKDENDNVVITYKSIKQLLNELQLPSSRTNEIKEQLEYFSKAAFIFEEKRTKQTKKVYFKDLFDNDDYIEMTDNVKATLKTTGNIPFFESMSSLEVESSINEDKKSVAFSIKLSPQFTKYSQKHSVPINYTIYKNISSPIGKDLYAWLIYRNNSINRGDPVFIPMSSLVEQFMPVKEDSVKTQERTNYDYLKTQILQIKAKYYPDLNVSFDATGMTLYKSKAQIENNDQHYVLVTSNL